MTSRRPDGDIPRRRSDVDDDAGLGMTGQFIRVVIMAYLFFLVWMELDAYMYWMEEAAKAGKTEAAAAATGFVEVNIPDEL